jgi:hypothetical protein
MTNYSIKTGNLRKDWEHRKERPGLGDFFNISIKGILCVCGESQGLDTMLNRFSCQTKLTPSFGVGLLITINF